MAPNCLRFLICHVVPLCSAELSALLLEALRLVDVAYRCGFPFRLTASQNGKWQSAELRMIYNILWKRWISPQLIFRTGD